MGAHERQAAERLVWCRKTPADSAAASVSLLWDLAGASGGGSASLCCITRYACPVEQRRSTLIALWLSDKQRVCSLPAS